MSVESIIFLSFLVVASCANNIESDLAAVHTFVAECYDPRLQFTEKMTKLNEVKLCRYEGAGCDIVNGTQRLVQFSILPAINSKSMRMSIACLNTTSLQRLLHSLSALRRFYLEGPCNPSHLQVDTCNANREIKRVVRLNSPFPDISGNPDLEEFICPNCDLSGTFPTSFVHAKLKTLDLAYNALSGPFPPFCSTPPYVLNRLFLSNAEFTGALPQSLKNCNFIAFVLDNHGDITGDFSVFDNSADMSVFAMSTRARLQSALTGVFLVQSYLSTLNIVNERLEALVTPTNGTSLSAIVLRDNVFMNQQLPRNLLPQSIFRVFITNNSHGGHIHFPDFAPALEYVNISSAGFQGIRWGTIFPQLKTLDISHNPLTSFTINVSLADCDFSKNAALSNEPLPVAGIDMSTADAVNVIMAIGAKTLSRTWRSLPTVNSLLFPTVHSTISNQLRVVIARNASLTGSLWEHSSQMWDHIIANTSTDDIQQGIEQVFANQPMQAAQATFFVPLLLRSLGTDPPLRKLAVNSVEYMHSPFLLPFISQIDLADNYIEGQFFYDAPPDGLPNPWACALSLRQLNLRGNLLSGAIPWDLLAASNLTELDLSSNKFTYHLPQSFADSEQWLSLSVLNLSHNFFISSVAPSGVQGALPIFRCRSIAVIDLSFNPTLRGCLSRNTFDRSVLAKLRYVGLSNTNLTGVVPQDLVSRVIPSSDSRRLAIDLRNSKFTYFPPITQRCVGGSCRCNMEVIYIDSPNWWCSPQSTHSNSLPITIFGNTCIDEKIFSTQNCIVGPGECGNSFSISPIINSNDRLPMRIPIIRGPQSYDIAFDPFERIVALRLNALYIMNLSSCVSGCDRLVGVRIWTCAPDTNMDACPDTESSWVCQSPKKLLSFPSSSLWSDGAMNTSNLVTWYNNDLCQLHFNFTFENILQLLDAEQLRYCDIVSPAQCLRRLAFSVLPLWNVTNTFLNLQRNGRKDSFTTFRIVNGRELTDPLFPAPQAETSLVFFTSLQFSPENWDLTRDVNMITTPKLYVVDTYNAIVPPQVEWLALLCLPGTPVLKTYGASSFFAFDSNAVFLPPPGRYYNVTFVVYASNGSTVSAPRFYEDCASIDAPGREKYSLLLLTASVYAPPCECINCCGGSSLAECDAASFSYFDIVGSQCAVACPNVGLWENALNCHVSSYCPRGLHCNGTEFLETQPGYWRASYAILTAEQCLGSEPYSWVSCPGTIDKDSVPSASSLSCRVHSIPLLDAQCGTGHCSTLCGACRVGYVRDRNFVCDECSKYSPLVFTVLAILGICLLVFVAVIQLREARQTVLSSCQNSPVVSPVAASPGEFPIISPKVHIHESKQHALAAFYVKLLLTSFQTSDAVDRAEVGWPGPVSAISDLKRTVLAVMDSASILCVVDFMNSFRIRFFGLISLYTIICIFFFAVGIIQYRHFLKHWNRHPDGTVSRKIRAKKYVSRGKYSISPSTLWRILSVCMVFLLFSLYQPTVNVISEAFLCVHVGSFDPDPPSSQNAFTSWRSISDYRVLVADVSMQCPSTTNVTEVFFVAMMAALFCVFFLPLGTAILLKTLKPWLFKSRTTIAMFGFLYSGYVAKAYWFECVILVRKSITVLIVSIGEGSLQLSMLMWVLGCELAITLWLRPYEGDAYYIQVFALTAELVRLSVGSVYIQSNADYRGLVASTLWKAIPWILVTLDVVVVGVIVYEIVMETIPQRFSAVIRRFAPWALYRRFWGRVVSDLEVSLPVPSGIDTYHKDISRLYHRVAGISKRSAHVSSQLGSFLPRTQQSNARK